MAASKKPLARLTLEKIQSAEDIREDVVDVPEWGGSVKVRGVSKAAWDKWLVLPSEDGEDAAFLLSEALVEPQVTPEQALALRDKSAAALNRIEAAVSRLSSAEGAERRFLDGDS